LVGSAFFYANFMPAGDAFESLMIFVPLQVDFDILTNRRSGGPIP
jgi:hypothetical protein